jgi:foldase protein PrsA
LVVALCGAVRYCWGPLSANADPSGRRDATSRSASRSSADDDRRAVPQDQQDSPESSARETRSSNPKESSVPEVVATVNTQRITRDELAKHCLRHFGKEVLERMVNKRLIALECRQQGIKVTRSEVNADIDRMAMRFKIPVDQWMKMVTQEGHMTSEQYASEIIWPMIALRKLAGGQLKVTRQEVQDEFDTQYGEQIRVRLIAASNLEKARS